ncbi:MAG: hypothetical protein AB7V48_07485 [Sedimentibacter sp.]
MKLIYLTLVIIAMLLLLLDSLLKTKNKTSASKILTDLSKHKLFKQDKESKSYKSLKKDLIGAGLNVSPELFNVSTMFLAVISVIVVVAVSYINKINLIINMDQLNAAAEALGMPELTEVNFNISINLVLYTFLAMLFLPRGILKLAGKFKLILEENEILMLQTYALMMIKANKPVKEILISLMNRSRMFKGILRKAVNTFSDDPDEALRNARESTGNQGFDKIIRALEQALNYDRNVSLQFLKNHRNLTKELGALNNIKKNNTKAMISTLLLVVPLAALAFIAGYPFLNYAIKMLNGSIF